jgi:hypothetical protein
VPSPLVREMGCTLADFARWLPGATRHAPVVSQAAGEGMRHEVSVGGGTIDIDLQPLPPRRIALFCLPVLQVTFRFNDLEQSERVAFLTHFDHYTRRGGG